MEVKQSKDQKTSQRSYANFINTNLMDRELIVKDPPPRYIKRWLNSYLLLITLQFQVWNFSLFWTKKAKLDNFLTFMLNNYNVQKLNFFLLVLRKKTVIQLSFYVSRILPHICKERGVNNSHSYNLYICMYMQNNLINRLFHS